MAVRRPAVAGSFYPANPAKLRESMEASYLHRLGPGKLPLKEAGTSGGLQVCVCPHAGYTYSGPVAAHSYLEVSKLRKPELVVVVGPDHYGLGSGAATYGEGEWETPLGVVPVDLEATKRAVELAGVVIDPAAHRKEHSIEVQLPFLQMIYAEGLKFLPISLAFQDKVTARRLGKGLAEILREREAKGGAVLVASSDLTHYEPASQARQKDSALLKQVERMDLDAFYMTLERIGNSACGYGAIATAMEASRILGFRQVRVNAYHTSGDVTGDDGAVVGYPSVSFFEA